MITNYALTGVLIALVIISYAKSTIVTNKAKKINRELPMITGLIVSEIWTATTYIIASITIIQIGVIK